MGLAQKAIEQKEILLPKWIKAFLATYPLSSTGLMRGKKDFFANPVGEITKASLDILFDAVMGLDMEPSTTKEALTELVQLRAIQDMSPSTALGPLYRIKSIVQSELLLPSQESATSHELKELWEEFYGIESRVDSLAIMSFNIYTERREKISQIRIDEIKRSQSQVVRWAKLRGDDEESPQNYKREG